MIGALGAGGCNAKASADEDTGKATAAEARRLSGGARPRAGARPGARDADTAAAAGNERHLDETPLPARPGRPGRGAGHGPQRPPQLGPWLLALAARCLHTWNPGYWEDSGVLRDRGAARRSASRPRAAPRPTATSTRPATGAGAAASTSGPPAFGACAVTAGPTPTRTTRLPQRPLLPPRLRLGASGRGLGAPVQRLGSPRRRVGPPQRGRRVGPPRRARGLGRLEILHR